MRQRLRGLVLLLALLAGCAAAGCSDSSSSTPDHEENIRSKFQ